MTIIDYIKSYGDHDFYRMAFNAVDALILATLAYADLEYAPFGKISNFNCTVRELVELVKIEHLERLMRHRRRRTELLKLAADSRRFGDLLMHDYRHIIDTDKEEQFAAITFTLNTDRGYVDFIAYQGTDDTLIGWKEDFNMSFQRHVPAQRDALKYLHHIANQSSNYLMLGGHSKGGNLATYAGLKAGKELKPRILAVYDFDGPGFLSGTFTAMERRGVVDKIHKVIPEGSVVGRLMTSQTKDVTVVRSDGIGLRQHDSLTWQIDGDYFATGQLTKLSDKTRVGVQQIMSSLTTDQRRQVVNEIYRILSGTGEETMPGLKKYLAKNMPTILRQVRITDPTVRQTTLDILGMLGKAMVKKPSDKFDNCGDID